MSQGFNPLSMFKPMGNPVVQKLLQNHQSTLSELLDQQSFPTQFRKQKNETLEKYMTYQKYAQLVEYITEIGNIQNKKRSFKYFFSKKIEKQQFRYPFIAAEILSIQNKHTEKYFISKKHIIQQQIIIEEIQIEQQVDSDRSFMSSRSEGSIISDESQAEKQSEKGQVEDINQMPEIQTEKRPSEINEDDFPFTEDVKKYKKIKQKRQKIVVHEYEPLFNRLLDYFNKPLNHTLTGYICKVINALLTSNNTIYSKILEKVQATLLENHLQSRSTQQLLVRLLTFENQEQNDIKLQYNLMLLCLHKIYEKKDSLVIQNLSFLICQIFLKFMNETNLSFHHKKLIKQLVRLTFFHKVSQYFEQTVKKLEQCLKNNQIKDIQIIQIQIRELAKIFQSFVQFYLKIKENQYFKQLCTSVFSEYQDSFNQFVEATYKRLYYEAFQTINESVNCLKKFGMIKILLINIVFRLIKQNLGFCQQILAEKNNFFEIVLHLVEKSPLNSIFHNSVFSIFNFFIDNLAKKNEVVVIGSVFRQVFDTQSPYSILKFSSKTFKINKNAKFVERKGYTGHLIKFFCSIQSLEHIESQALNKFKKTDLWSQIIESQIQPYRKQTQLNLGNFIKKKNVLAPIEFEKSVILEIHKQFLKGTKFMTLDEFQNFIDDDNHESDSDDYNHYHSNKQNRETERQIQEMQIQEFMINSGLKTEIKQFNLQALKQAQKTSDSISTQ